VLIASTNADLYVRTPIRTRVHSVIITQQNEAYRIKHGLSEPAPELSNDSPSAQPGIAPPVLHSSRTHKGWSAPLIIAALAYTLVFVMFVANLMYAWRWRLLNGSLCSRVEQGTEQYTIGPPKRLLKFCLCVGISYFIIVSVAILRRSGVIFRLPF
jgi:hypothetical protein